jgi:thiamine-phosphate pyrophosphorylase
MSNSNSKESDNLFAIYRVIDANLNRLKEGIRVVEDIYRYIYNDKNIASRLKIIRHTSKIEHQEYKKYLQQRDILGDPLIKSTKDEQQRDNLPSVIVANYKRAEESARVLEEMLKLVDVNRAEVFKTIRYSLYDLEKQILDKI